MIDEVTIKNFKSINNLDIKGFSLINLIGGKNNAGKTTFLEAIFMFYDRLAPDVILKQLGWRGISQIKVSADTIFSPIFYNFDSHQRIEVAVIENRKKVTLKIKYNSDINKFENIKKSFHIEPNSNIEPMKTTERLSDDNLNLVIEHSDGKKTERLQHILSKEGITVNVEYALNKNLKQCIFLSSKGFANSDEDAMRFSQLDVEGKYYQVVDFLKIIEPNIKGISNILSDNKTSMLYIDVGLKKKVPISYMGDGVTRLATIILAILSNPNGIVFIDEIENGIHHSVLPKIWSAITDAAISSNCQIFASTHSYECLNSMVVGIDENYKSKIKYFRLEKKESNIVAKKFDYDMLKTSIENSWEVR